MKQPLRWTRWIAMVVVAVAITLSIGGIIVNSQADAAPKIPKCNKQCRQRNDHFMPKYDDYFINDSDGKKDFIFAVYHKVPFLDGDQRVVCDVLKSFDTEGVGIAIVCPNGRVINGTASNGVPPSN